MTETQVSPKAPRRRGLRIALIVSLTINVLLIGLLVGGAMRASLLEAATGGRPDLHALWRAMPSEARETLRETARGTGLAMSHGRPDREARRARAALINAALVEAMRAETFDAAAFADLLAGDRAEAAHRVDAAYRVLAAQIAALSVSERAALAQRFEANLRGPMSR